LLAIFLIAIGGSKLHAADVECFGPQELYDGRSISDAAARKLWPSGFRPVAGMCFAGFLRGTILQGHYEKVRTFLAQQKNYMTLFVLVSPGGDVNEAMMIGRLFKKYLIHTWSPEYFLDRFFLPNFGTDQPPRYRCEGADCVCASACALIWFGGVSRSGSVGLHRPRISDPTFKALPPAEAAKVYRKALDDITRYLDEMEAPRPMVDAMVATDSSNIWWVNAEFDRLEQPPTYAEWAESACGNFSKQEQDTLNDLIHRKSSGNLTSNDTLLLQLLSDKEVTHRTCAMYLRSSHVEQLPPP